MNLKETIQRLVRQVLLQEAKVNDMNLASRLYADYNTKYFGGKLPSGIEISEKSIKGSYAIASASVVRKKYERIRNIEPSNVQVKGIYFSNYYKLTEEQMKGILLHEMIHIYLFSNGVIKTTGGPSGHGREFEEVRSKISSASGIKIPISEDVTGVEIVPKGKLMVGAVFKKGSGNGIIMLSPSFWARDGEPIKAWLAKLDELGIIKEPIVFQTKSASFQEIPTKRSLGKSISVYTVPDDIAEEARENILWKLK